MEQAHRRWALNERYSGLRVRQIFIAGNKWQVKFGRRTRPEKFDFLIEMTNLRRRLLLQQKAG